MSGQDYISQLIYLKSAVRESREITDAQIKSVNTSAGFLLTLISLAVSLGLSVTIQKLLIYWIPLSFLIMSVWTFVSVVQSYKNFRRTSLKDLKRGEKKYGAEAMDYGSGWVFMTVIANVQAISILFIVTLIGLILVSTGTFSFRETIPAVWPIVVAAFYLISVASSASAVRPAQQGVLRQSLKDLQNKFSDAKIKRLVNIVNFFIMTISLAIPVSALAVIIPSFIPLRSQDVLALLTLLMQGVIIIMSMSYFTGRNVKQQLGITMSSLITLQEELNHLPNDKEVEQEKLDQFKKRYDRAKPFDFKIRNMFIVNYYELAMNRQYLMEILGERAGPLEEELLKKQRKSRSVRK